MKKLNRCLNNLKKLLKNNLISILIIIILVILIIYFLIDIRKNNIINENFTNSEEENTLQSNSISNIENENSNSLTGEEMRSMYMMEGETSEERRIMSMMEGETSSEMNTLNEESDMNYLSSLVELTSEENITNSVVRNMLSEEENSILIQEEIGMEKPSTQSFRFNNPTPISINVSYNTKNSINDSNIADDDVYSNVKNIDQADNLNDESTSETSMNTLSESNTGTSMNTLSESQSSSSSNNSNTSSNGLSWSLSSDYYIPGVTNVNQNYNSEENETTNSYPYLYEQPWSNYKSGDN